MQDVKVTTFNVGQGLFNLVTGTLDEGEPYCGIFDCGNFADYNDYNRISEALNLLESFPSIDHVVISHQDEDHWRNLIDLILTFNDCAYSESTWYRLPHTCSPTYMINFSRQYINECTFNKIDGVTYASQLINTFIDEVFVLTRCYIYEESNYLKSYWITNFSVYTSPFYAKISATKVEGIYLISITGSKTLEVVLGEIHQGLIQLISECQLQYVKNNIDKIYELLSIALNLYHYSLQDYKNIFNQSPVIEKYIKNLYIGGLDCNRPYELFKGIIENFAKMSYSVSSFANIIPDMGITGQIITFWFEKNLVNHKGKKLDTKGGVYKNATSQVTSLSLSKHDIALFPGDTTFHAFRSIFNRLGKKKLQLFIAPHHGSYKSNFAFKQNPDRTVSLLEKQPLENLLTAYPPNVIHISAEHSRFGHPSESFVKICNDKCLGTAPPHFVVYCPDNAKDAKQLPTEKAVFTTESVDFLNFTFNFPTNLVATPLLDANFSVASTQIPENDLFISYGGFNL